MRSQQQAEFLAHLRDVMQEYHLIEAHLTTLHRHATRDGIPGAEGVLGHHLQEIRSMQDSAKLLYGIVVQAQTEGK